MVENEKKKKKKNREGKEKPGLAVLLYVKGVSEAAVRVLKKHGISSAFNPANTISQHMFRLKDKKHTSKSEYAIYKIGL